MKGSKKAFFIVLICAVAIYYIAAFGLQITEDLYIPGANEMRTGIDIRGGVEAVFEPKDLGRTPTAAELETAKQIIETRMNKSNILDRDVFVDNTNGYITVRFPWKENETEFDPSKAINELGAVAKLTIKGEENSDPNQAVLLEGKHITSATVEQYQSSGTSSVPATQRYLVALKFDSEGAALFADITEEYLNKTLYTYMDDMMISAATVSSHITGGEAVIQGISDLNNNGSNLDECKTLANQISSGSLPFSMQSRNHSSISATLGEGALKVMLNAGMIAFILICAFLIFYYRLPGCVACIALGIQVAGQILALSIPQITLTLPGIAGLILSIGMGIDANVIISERISEELKSGKRLDAAISAGFTRAFSSVFDGNITVMIVAFILMWLGSGAILSFAYSLLTGVILNFVAGVYASRTMTLSLSKYPALRKDKFFTCLSRRITL